MQSLSLKSHVGTKNKNKSKEQKQQLINKKKFSTINKKKNTPKFKQSLHHSPHRKVFSIAQSTVKEVEPHIVVVPGQASFVSTLTEEEKQQRVKAFHDAPVSKATFDPNPLKQFLKWFNDVTQVEPIMPERMTMSTIRNMKDANGKIIAQFPSSRPVLLKEIITGDHMVSPYTLLAPPEPDSAPSTAGSIAKKSNNKPTSHFFPTIQSSPNPNQPNIFNLTGTTTPFPQELTNALLATGGFTFVCNYTSAKAQDIEENNTASLTFHWVELERVVRIEGFISRVPEGLSELYHSQRPRGSQISALASHQSMPIEYHGDIVERYNEVDALVKQGKYEHISTLNVNRPGRTPIRPPTDTINENGENMWVPKADQWGGYVVIPERIEFWQGKPSRFHERLVYTPSDGKLISSGRKANEKIAWDMTYLQP